MSFKISKFFTSKRALNAYFYAVPLTLTMLFKKNLTLKLSPLCYQGPWVNDRLSLYFFVFIMGAMFNGSIGQAQVRIEFPNPQQSTDSIPALGHQEIQSVGVPEHSNDTLNQEPFYYILQGDSLVRQYIDLNEVVLLKRLSFNDMAERRKYIILRRRTLKVYPYAKLAAERLAAVDERLKNIKRKSKRKKYIRQVQKYSEGEFYETLRKFTRAEGRILVKLIHRQTGQSTFDLIRDYRSGWRAFWYNQTAHWFDIDLKSEYQPFDNKEDYYIEDILQRGFRDNLIERQNPYNPIDILALESFWAADKK